MKSLYLFLSRGLLAFLRLLMTSLLAGTWLTVAAQPPPTVPAEPPPGGYEVTQVNHLQPVPQPPGGLIPFHEADSHLWGYCDTLGRVWIRPTIDMGPYWDYHERRLLDHPSFFNGPFGQYYDRECCSEFVVNNYVFINARGETIRADHTTAVLQEADGSLVLRPRREWLWKEAVFRFEQERGTGKILLHSANCSLDEPPFWYTQPVSGGRGIGFHQSTRPPEEGEWPSLQVRRGALLDEQGRPLTEFAYWHIRPFSEGVAVAQQTGYPQRGGIELLTRQGRKILASGPVTYATDVCRNRAAIFSAVGADSGSAIIDTTGRLVRGWQPGWVQWAIPGYLFSELLGTSQPPAQRLYRLLDPADGHALLGGQRFRQVSPLLYRSSGCSWLQSPFSEYYPAVVVCDTTGRWGVLSRDCQWLFPCSAERLVPLPGHLLHPIQQATLYVRVAGRWGVIDARNGRALVPVQYDSLASPLVDGWLAASRAGQSVVLYRGREVATGTLVLPAYWEVGYSKYARTLRRADGRVTLIDTTGRALLPWLPNVDLLIASSDLDKDLVWGARLDPKAPGSIKSRALLDQQGHPITPWGVLSDRRYGLMAFRKGGVYNRSGKLLTTERGVQLMSGGWIVTRRAAALIDSTGRRYLPPPGCRWETENLLDYSAPFEHGVMYLDAALPPKKRWRGPYLVTRSGRVVR